MILGLWCCYSGRTSVLSYVVALLRSELWFRDELIRTELWFCLLYSFNGDCRLMIVVTLTP